MNDKNKITRALEGELRTANRDDGKEQGIMEGYFARWDQVDSHNTRFQKGCFAKSIKERMGKIVVRNSHGNPIGKPLEIREDDIGAFFVGQVDLDVQEAREAFSLVKNEIITGLSFGFQNINDKIGKDGIRTFTEVMLLEISPTWLPSGDDSRITNVRDGENNLEKRADHFTETVLENTSNLLWNSIQETISDVWWSLIFEDIDEAEAMVRIDSALGEFRDSYLEFASDWIRVKFSSHEEDDDEMRTSPISGIQTALAGILKTEKRTADQFIAEYKITEDTFKALCRGKHIADLTESSKLPEELRTLNNQVRAAKFEDGFTELRQFMSSGELKRSDALLRVCGNIKTNSKNIQEPELRSDDILAALNKI